MYNWGALDLYNENIVLMSYALRLAVCFFVLQGKVEAVPLRRILPFLVEQFWRKIAQHPVECIVSIWHHNLFRYLNVAKTSMTFRNGYIQLYKSNKGYLGGVPKK